MKIGPTNPNIAERLQKADQALENVLNNQDRAIDKKLDQAAGQLDKAGANLGKAGKAGKNAAVDALAAGVDTAFAVGDAAAGTFHGAKGVGFSLAGLAGKVTEGVRHALAEGFKNLAVGFAKASSVSDGRQLTLHEIKADPKAQTFSDRMFTKSAEQFSKSANNFKNMFEDVASGVLSGALGVVDLTAAGVYLTAAAGRTLAAAEKTGEAVVIANAQAAVELAQGIVKGAEAGNARVADGLSAAAMKLIQVSNQINTVNNPKYQLTQGVGY